MPYQSVGTPKFFIDHALWLHHSGVYTNEAFSELLTLNPSTFKHYTGIASLEISIPQYAPITYVAYLGHRMATHGGELSVRGFIPEDYKPRPPFTSTVNLTAADAPTYDGFSIAEFTNDPDWTEVYASVNATTGASTPGAGIASLGAVSIGSTYTMPNAPNLSLTMSRDYGGTKEFTTYNGSSMSNTMWNKAPKWGAYSAWELGDNSINQAFARSGRRSWSLKFSYMDDGDLWGPNQSLSNYLETSDGYDSEDVSDEFVDNLLDNDNFFSQVWSKTLGGTLPFIFQPNKDDNIDYAICKFVDNSLKATQSAFNVYDISLNIEEVW